MKKIKQLARWLADDPYMGESYAELIGERLGKFSAAEGYKAREEAAYHLAVALEGALEEMTHPLPAG